MIFYKLQFTSAPKIEFAFSVQSDRYDMSIPVRDNIIETVLNLGSPFIGEIRGERYTVDTHTVILAMPDSRYHGFFESDGKLFTQNVAVYFERFQYQRYEEESPERIAEILAAEETDSCLFLPCICRLDEEASYLSSIFNSLILHHAQNTPAEHMNALSDWYRILALLSRKFHTVIYETLVSDKKNAYYYSNRVKKIIAVSYGQNLSVNAIAKDMKITPSYLSTICRKELGMTFSDYLNRVRMEHARTLVQSNQYSYEQIAEAVGYKTVRHLQKMFKRYYGISIRECSLIDNSIISLQIPFKPWEKT